MYIAYICDKCNTVFIMPTEHLNKRELEGRYLACPYGHKDLKVLDKYDTPLECMQHDKYKKVSGTVKQIGWSK